MEVVARVGVAEARRERERREAWVVRSVKAGCKGAERGEVVDSRERRWHVQ